MMNRHDTAEGRVKTLARKIVVTDHYLITAGTDDKITFLVNHNLGVGDTVSFMNGTGGTIPAGITAGSVIYYAVPIPGHPTQIKLSTSLAGAIAGTGIVDITSAGVAPNYANLGMIATETAALWTPNHNENLCLKSMAVKCYDQVGTAGTGGQITITANGATIVAAQVLPVVLGKIRNLPVLTTDIDSSFSDALPLTLLLSTAASNIGSAGVTPTNTRLIYKIITEAWEFYPVSK